VRIPEGIERVQIDALVFHRPPQPLNENVIHPVTLTIDTRISLDCMAFTQTALVN